jgi:hypothetical protein
MQFTTAYFNGLINKLNVSRAKKDDVTITQDDRGLYKLTFETIGTQCFLWDIPLIWNGTEYASVEGMVEFLPWEHEQLLLRARFLYSVMYTNPLKDMPDVSREYHQSSIQLMALGYHLYMQNNLLVIRGVDGK